MLVPSEGHGPPGATDLSQTIQQRRMQNNRHVHRWTRGPWQQKCASDAENHIFYFNAGIGTKSSMRYEISKIISVSPNTARISYRIPKKVQILKMLSNFYGITFVFLFLVTAKLCS